MGSLELEVFPLQTLEFLAHLGGCSRLLSRIALCLPNPQSQRLGPATELLSNRQDRSPLRTVLIALLANHPDCSLSNFRAVTSSMLHRSILSNDRDSGKAGAAQEIGRASCREREGCWG